MTKETNLPIAKHITRDCLAPQEKRKPISKTSSHPKQRTQIVPNCRSITHPYRWRKHCSKKMTRNKQY